MRQVPLSLQILALGAVGLGLVFTVLFHVGTQERPREPRALVVGDGTAVAPVRSSVLRMTWKDWFKEPQFYLVSGQGSGEPTGGVILKSGENPWLERPQGWFAPLGRGTKGESGEGQPLWWDDSQE